MQLRFVIGCNLAETWTSWIFSLLRHPIKCRILYWADNHKEIHFAKMLTVLMPKQTFGSYATLMRFRFGVVIGFNLPETWTSWIFSLLRHPIKCRISYRADNQKDIHFSNLLTVLVPKQTFGSYATLMCFRFVIGCNLPETWTSWNFSLLKHPIKCRILCWADNQKEIHF